MAKTKKLRDHASDLGSRVQPTMDSAREKAAPLIADARERTAPLIADARDKAGPALHEARDRFSTEVLPALTAAVAAAGAATEDVRGETKKRGKAVAAALKGEVEAPKEKHRLRKLLILAGLGGVAAYVVKKMSDREPTTTWQSSYTPTSAPGASSTSTTTPGAHRADAAETADDAGGSSPDVAAADAAATPHEATTPDSPAERVDVSKK